MTISVNENWATNITFQDIETLHPASIEELRKIVMENPKVRARGSTHSFNTIADTREVAVILDQMPSLLSIDPDSQTMTVSAGLNYAQISEFLAAHGWAIHNLASLPHISIAGAIATGTHGSGIGNGALHTAVRSVELMSANGSIYRLTRGVDDDFYSAVVSLGLAGIVISYEIDIQPSFEIMQSVYGNLPRATFSENLIAILSSAYSVSYFTTWGDDQAGDLWVKSKSSNPVHVFGAVARTEKAHPLFGLDPESCTEQLGVPGPWHLRLSHFRIDANPSAGNELQSEFFVASHDASAAFAAIEAISDQFRHKLMVTEIRAIAADSHWLSPAFERETIAFHCTWQNDQEVPSLVALIESALAPFSPRPHFGKVFNLRSDQIRSVFPRFEDFQRYLKRIDPMGKFQNEFTAALFSF